MENTITINGITHELVVNAGLKSWCKECSLRSKCYKDFICETIFSKKYHHFEIKQTYGCNNN